MNVILLQVMFSALDQDLPLGPITNNKLFDADPLSLLRVVRPPGQDLLVQG
jgi:hypothetical protein